MSLLSLGLRGFQKQHFRTDIKTLTQTRFNLHSSWISTTILIPSLLYALTTGSLQSLTSPSPSLLLLAFFSTIIFNHYSELLTHFKMMQDTVARIGLASSFVTACVIHLLWGFGDIKMSWITVLSAVLEFVGIHLLSGADIGTSILPISSNVYTSSIPSQGSLGQLLVNWSVYLVKKILQDKGN